MLVATLARVARVKLVLGSALHNSYLGQSELYVIAVYADMILKILAANFFTRELRDWTAVFFQASSHGEFL